jgi:hypothetical protein
MTEIDRRNENAKLFVSTRIKSAIKTRISAQDQLKFSKELQLLKDLIPINAAGFRGVVLTSIVGMYLDSKFDPTKNFYACNPRSIFEKGIYYALQENDIPCGKSDPLNVAKNIQQLDDSWAVGRRPQSAAMAAVKYLKLLLKSRNTAAYDKLVDLFFLKLHDYGSFVSKQNAPISTHSIADIPLVTANKLASFVIECSEAGANTQYITGLLIKYLREHDADYRRVLGFDESVFGTNTTAKKPADVWEVLADNSLGNIYEITVKVIDKKRLDDCVESITKLKLQQSVITFICELPKNIQTLSVTNNTCIHKGVAFQFLDIREFVIQSFCLLNSDKRRLILSDIQKYVFSINRALKTKQYWKTNFS